MQLTLCLLSQESSLVECFLLEREVPNTKFTHPVLQISTPSFEPFRKAHASLLFCRRASESATVTSYHGLVLSCHKPATLPPLDTACWASSPTEVYLTLPKSLQVMAIPENREFQKWKLSFFHQRHTLTMSFDIFVITYRVTNFLPKPINLLLFSTEKTEFPFLVFPYFRVRPQVISPNLPSASKRVTAQPRVSTSQYRMHFLPFPGNLWWTTRFCTRPW